ncbi:putative YccA/Bax inhibitor family protein [Glaciihabitans tibetensis]|uniref:Putative YccA/Bax inhibitor family protein n=1 Tax=Glaciihabitans tibetensis TaxID=1266600 RepID=A0A2T0VBQ5_9MICO|nr:Bax inhibitor-1/YccA family protein [Glaciihabitans tibetensis]PRY67615.1 putative YccA/Bax inhibitor family protein [Glaciihabitans tibetensis]
MALSSNPAFKNAAFGNGGAKAANAPTMTSEQLDELYGRPSAGPAETDRMSYEDVIVKTIGTLAFVLVGGVVGFFLPALAIPAALIGFGLALVNIFKKRPSPALILTYGLVEGVFLGGLSGILESQLPGIIGQALLGTGLVFGVTLALFANGKVRASARATKVFTIAMISYGLFALVNFGLQLTGISNDPWGLATGFEIFGIPLGLIIGPLVILMAAYSLVLDFTSIGQGVRAGAPRILGWRAAFGLVLTIVWLYTEILRLIAIFRSN